MARSINPLVYSLYFGELFCQPIEEFNRKGYVFPYHFHAQCSCHACRCWVTDDGLQYRLTDTDEFSSASYRVFHSALNTVVLEDIDVSFKIEAITLPWQLCDCQYCKPLHVKKTFDYTVNGGNVTMRDVKNLRKMISSIQVTSNSSIWIPNGEDSDVDDEQRVPGGEKIIDYSY